MNAEAYLMAYDYLQNNPEEYVETLLIKNKDGLQKQTCHRQVGGCASNKIHHHVNLLFYSFFNFLIQ